MKIAAFSVRQDEKQYFDTFANVYKVELQINRSGFTADDIESVKGCEAMSVCDGMCDLSAPVLEKLAAEALAHPTWCPGTESFPAGWPGNRHMR